jgi:hypothetical protein
MVLPFNSKKLLLFIKKKYRVVCCFKHIIWQKKNIGLFSFVFFSFQKRTFFEKKRKQNARKKMDQTRL